MQTDSKNAIFSATRLDNIREKKKTTSKTQTEQPRNTNRHNTNKIIEVLIFVITFAVEALSGIMEIPDKENGE